MNMEFDQSSHLSFTTSQNAFRLDHSAGEDLEFLTNPVHQNQNLYPITNQFAINPTPPNQQILFNSFFEQILAKCSTETNASYEQNNFWVTEEDLLVASQQLQFPQQISYPKLPSKKIQKSKKRKTLYSQKYKSKPKKRQSQEALKQRLFLQLKIRSETKNIPKNYGKAIIGFILKNQSKVRFVPGYESFNFEELKRELKEIKRGIKTIADLRSLWVDCKHAKLIRTLGNFFLRKYSLSYVFNSKIESTESHVKYRSKLLRAIKKPQSFQYIKGL